MDCGATACRAGVADVDVLLVSLALRVLLTMFCGIDGADD